MRAIFLAAALAAPAFAAPPAREFTVLPPGRYAIVLTGLVTTVCGRAIAAEWGRLPEVESASVDFDRSVGYVSIRLNRTLKVSALRHSLRRAERLANLKARYELHEITYRLSK